MVDVLSLESNHIKAPCRQFGVDIFRDKHLVVAARKWPDPRAGSRTLSTQVGKVFHPHFLKLSTVPANGLRDLCLLALQVW